MDLSLELLLDSVDVEKYNELIKTHFFHEDIEFTPSEVFNYFVYENQNELKSQDVIDEVAGLVEQDISFISLDPKRLSVMIMGAHNDRAIKNVLNHLFGRHRSGKWNSYDTTTAISYLIQSEFRHIDLIKALETESPPLHRYIVLTVEAVLCDTLRAKSTDHTLILLSRTGKPTIYILCIA